MSEARQQLAGTTTVYSVQATELEVLTHGGLLCHRLASLKHQKQRAILPFVENHEKITTKIGKEIKKQILHIYIRV